MKDFTHLPFEPDAIAEQVVGRYRRVLLWGEANPAKTRLLTELARHAAVRDPIACMNCDPGSPAFGPPGVVSLGWCSGETWMLEAFEPLCSLDAARFRLPLVQAVAKLTQLLPDGRALVSVPGFLRGMAAAELLTALVATTAPDALILLHGSDQTAALGNELAGTGLPVFAVLMPAPVSGFDAATRAKSRTGAWDDYLRQGRAHGMMLDGLRLLGAPPPTSATGAWAGRQVAVGMAERWIGLGEVIRLQSNRLDLRIVGEVAGADRLLIRDAARDANHQLRTRRPAQPRRVGRVKQASRAQLEVRSGPLVANLVNGVTGDPLLMLRQRHRRGAFLFDAGDSHGLSQRLLHTVTDVFVTHAHLDHLAGFPYLLRSRLSARLPPLRLYGPPGTHEHIAGFLAGTRWDRIGEDGPEFEVIELEGSRIRRYQLKAGSDGVCGPRSDADDGLLLQWPELCVRAVELDHRIPVLAYSLEMVEQYGVDASRLRNRRLQPGPWIGDLKANVRRGDLDTLIRLPDGSAEPTRHLAEQLLRRSEGAKIVYATDFADHAANRHRIIDFASGAAVLFCESTFRNADRALAEDTQHLTTRACGEIAAAARAERLVPFHFSKRYEGDLAAVYREIQLAAGTVAVEPHGSV